MNWFYEYNREQRGPVSEDELDRLLGQGQISPATLVWREGMAAWAPLQQARPQTPTSAPPFPGDDIETCDSCGRSFSSAELIQIGGRQICAACKPLVLQKLQQGESLGSLADGQRDGPDWEQRATLGWWSAVLGTVKAVLGRPSETFARMRCTGGLIEPLGFYLLVGGFGLGLYVLYSIAAVYFMQPMLHGLPPEQQPFGGLHFTPATLVPLLLTVLLTTVIQATIGLFLQSGFLHLCLMLCGGARKPFETTFRVIAYGNGSVLSLMAFPVLGVLVAIPWLLVVNCIGLAKAHETELWRAVLATFLPMIVCCAAGIAMVMMFAAAANSGSLH